MAVAFFEPGLKRIKSVDTKALPKCISIASFHFCGGGGVPETNSETNCKRKGGRNDDGFVVTWFSQNSRRRRLQDHGPQVRSRRHGDQYPGVALSPDGTYVVTWQGSSST